MSYIKEYVVEANNLVIGYKNKIIKFNINFKIKENTWLAVIGDNGAGKTTFLKNILGIEKIISGELLIFGKYPGYRNQDIGYMPQEKELNLVPKISSKTIIKASYLANKFGITIFNSKINKKINDVLQLVEAETYSNIPFYNLSGGQKKRVYLAQLLINNPKLLILDEPLSDLDINSKNKFIKILKYICKQKNISLIVVSHEIDKITKQVDYFLHFKKNKIDFYK